MLEALQDIEIASRLVGFDTDSTESLDDKYKKLHCDISPLSHDSEDYRLIEKYLNTTHAPTHTVSSSFLLSLSAYHSLIVVTLLVQLLVFGLVRSGALNWRKFLPSKEKESLINMLRTGKNLAIRCSYGMVSQLLLATVRRLLKQIQYFWLIRYLSFVDQVPWLYQNNSAFRFSVDKLCWNSEPRTENCASRSSCYWIHG